MSEMIPFLIFQCISKVPIQFCCQKLYLCFNIKKNKRTKNVSSEYDTFTGKLMLGANQVYPNFGERPINLKCMRGGDGVVV